jgi:hypothetical protein
MRQIVGALAALGLTFSAAHPAPASILVPPAHAPLSSAAPGGVNLYDLEGRLVGALPGLPALTGAQAVLFSKATVVSLGAGPLELPAGVYFVGPQASAPARLPGLEPASFSFQDITPAFLPNHAWYPSDIQARDVNGDGRRDIVFSIDRNSCDPTPAYPFRVWIQEPDRTFVDETEARVPLVVKMGYGLELLDIDQDNDLDALLSGYSCTSHYVSAGLFINDGTGHFSDETVARLPQFGDDRFVYLMSSGYLDDDAFPDVAVTVIGSALFDSLGLFVAPEVWLNDGEGRLRRAVGSLPQPGKRGYLGVSTGDLTGDGRDDIAYANGFQIYTDMTGQPIDTLSGQTALFRNLGGGHFADETESRMPDGLERAQIWLPVADVDGDGDRDLLEVGFLFSENLPQLRLLLNDGSGHFALGVARGLDAATGWFNRPRFGRLSGGPGVDLFLPTVDPDAGGNALDMLLVNDGNGYFGDFSGALPSVSDFSVACALFDHEEDGDLDIATANAGPDASESGQNRLYRNGTVTVSVDPDRSARVAGLGLAFPSPATSWAKVRLSLAREGHTRLSIFDARGRFVRELMSQRLSAGEHRVSWDLRDAAGRPVGVGLYSFRLQAEGASLARRFVVTR